jgi:hypothetical protein
MAVEALQLPCCGSVHGMARSVLQSAGHPCTDLQRGGQGEPHTTKCVTPQPCHERNCVHGSWVHVGQMHHGVYFTQIDDCCSLQSPHCRSVQSCYAIGCTDLHSPATGRMRSAEALLTSTDFCDRICWCIAVNQTCN